MPAWPLVYTVDVTANVNVVTTNETIVATLSGVTLPQPNMRVSLHGLVVITSGVAATAQTLRFRRGTAITDPLVGEANAVGGGVAAGATSSIDVGAIDAPGELASGSYVLTIQQTAATGNGTALYAIIRAVVLV